ncbi:MAG: PA14 domain-containing protein [Chloroflexi bacterium]|nr:PA14 domain-containing protein [Chloroflexota bacterium]MCL5274447.1 PA14 domain-containing protein [Chloroflexota bacterium]
MIKTTRKHIANIAVVLIAVAALFISIPSNVFASQQDETATNAYSCLYIRVRWGDTLTRLSYRYGVSITAIKSANGLRGTRIYAGSTLCIPRYYAPAPPVIIYVPVPQYDSDFDCPYPWSCAPTVPVAPTVPSVPLCSLTYGCAPQQYYQWTAEFFQGLDTINGPFIVKVPAFASTLDTDWGWGAPYPGVPVNNWSVRFTQSVYLPAGNYNFWATTDDGVIVWLDSDQVINNWSASPSQTASGSTHAAVSAGQHLITVAYRHASGDAYIHMGWGAQ